MKPGIQTFFAEAGEAACYAICLIDVADEWGESWGQRPIDPCQALLAGVAAGRIHYNEDDPNDEDNFYVEAPALFLEDLTGIRWEVEKAEPRQEALVPAGSYCILRSERQATGVTVGHFWRRRFNSLRRSLCVERGQIVSLRVCTPLA